LFLTSSISFHYSAFMPTTNRQWKLLNRPKDLITPDVLQLSESPIPALAEGQALARVKYLSIDPTMRACMADIAQYMPPVQLAEGRGSGGRADVVEPRHAHYKKGDKLFGLTGMQEYLLLSTADKYPPQKLPSIPFLSDTDFVGLLGLNGITAYFGLLEIG